VIKITFTEEEIRMKAVELSFRTVSERMISRNINDNVFSVDYYQYVDEIAMYIRNGTKPIKQSNSKKYNLKNRY